MLIFFKKFQASIKSIDKTKNQAAIYMTTWLLTIDTPLTIN